MTAAALPEPKAVLRQVKHEGAVAVLKRASHDLVLWDAITNGVSSANADWLEVARLLKREADGALSFDLSVALGTALPKAPARVLDMFGTGVEADDVCGFYEPTRPNMTAAEGAAELRRHEAAVRKVRTKRLRLPREQCLALLERARHYAERQLE